VNTFLKSTINDNYQMYSLKQHQVVRLTQNIRLLNGLPDGRGVGRGYERFQEHFKAKAAFSDE